jgi:tetratricopeptide (TPR) repeat protein
LDKLAQLSPDSVQNVEGTFLRARILRDLDLKGSALSLLSGLMQRIGPTPHLLREIIELETATHKLEAAHAHRQQLLTLRYDDTDARRALISDDLANGDKQAVLKQLDGVRALSSGSLRSLLYIADVYDALGSDDLVLATYREAQRIAPEASDVYVAHARALLRADQQDAAYVALQKALLLRPQDAETRELLDEVRPSERADEGYAVPSKELLQRKQGAARYPYTVLEDLTVKTVYENGLGTEFHQLAVEIQDQEGARRFRTHAFQYDPDAQHVDLRLARVYRKDGRELESVRTFEQQLGEPWDRV